MKTIKFIHKTLLLFAFTFSAISLNAQQNMSVAFSKSYAYEYNGEYGKAISALTALNHDNYQINLRLGWLYYMSKEYLKSEAHYKKAVAGEPSSIEARFGMVLPLSAIGNWNAVLAVYLEVLKLDPNNSIANYRTASIYFNRKDYSNATAFVLKVIRLYPFDYDSNLLLGKICKAQNKHTEAKRYFEKALEYNPQSEEATNALKEL
jgi:tetratricopeptide (TPR) repeat protein